MYVCLSLKINSRLTSFAKSQMLQPQVDPYGLIHSQTKSSN